MRLPDFEDELDVLHRLRDVDDTADARTKADRVLIRMLQFLGYAEHVAAWEKIEKRKEDLKK